jgi:hypothetical protein
MWTSHTVFECDGHCAGLLVVVMMMMTMMPMLIRALFNRLALGTEVNFSEDLGYCRRRGVARLTGLNDSVTINHTQLLFA